MGYVYKHTWQPTEWRIPGTLEFPAMPFIHRMTSPFYEGERFAVRNDMGRVLNCHGVWEHEPMPSSRNDAFYERCRFKTFHEAVVAAESLELD